MELMRTAATSAWMLLGLLCMLAACAPQDDRPEQRVADAAALFAENCSPCHNHEGRGPALAELQALGPDELRAGIRNHPTAGEIPQRLPAASVQLLIEYLEQ